ncbi:short-chain dehydrogenase/reductase SDR [Xylogone sp. PMI_703]|nr:short-chain dehydrogenase/reductase SDR [Xylogone sp. PMI_703]
MAAESARVAIITGASQGIGRETAISLATQFSNIVLVARNKSGLQETANAIPGQSLIIPADLREKDAAGRVVSLTLEKFGRIDAVVNIAGAVAQVDLLDTTDEQWDDGFALKLHGARRLAVAAWPALKQNGGSVIFISGNSAELPKAPFAAVATVNAAIVALSKAFADQGYRDGIQVNCVLPGPVMTNRRRNYLEKWSAEHDMSVEEATKYFPKQAGIARYGDPKEIASLIKYILSPEAQWMTGSAIRMDGGEVKTV